MFSSFEMYLKDFSNNFVTSKKKNIKCLQLGLVSERHCRMGLLEIPSIKSFALLDKEKTSLMSIYMLWNVSFKVSSSIYMHTYIHKYVHTHTHIICFLSAQEIKQ